MYQNMKMPLGKELHAFEPQCTSVTNILNVRLVGLRGYKLKPAVKRYLAAELAVQEARRKPPHRQHRIAKRLPAGTLQKLVAEYVAGTPAAELGRRYGLAKAPCSLSCAWPAYPSGTHG